MGKRDNLDDRMRVSRLVMGGGSAAAAVSLAIACSAPPPPILGDPDSGTTDVYVPPCSVPAEGCPCEEAGVQEVCGTVYHYAGSYTTCAKEYITCQDDGTWSDCVGPTVFGAD